MVDPVRVDQVAVPGQLAAAQLAVDVVVGAVVGIELDLGKLGLALGMGFAETRAVRAGRSTRLSSSCISRDSSPPRNRMTPLSIHRSRSAWRTAASPSASRARPETVAPNGSPGASGAMSNRVVSASSALARRASAQRDALLEVGLAGVRGDAAVGDDDRAGHVAGIVRGEESDERGDLLGPSRPAQRDAPVPEGAVIRIGDAGRRQRGRDQAGADRVDADRRPARNRPQARGCS